MTATRIVKWVIAHEPAYLFYRTAEAFAKEIEAASKGTLKIEILTTSEYAEKYNAGTSLESPGEIPVKNIFQAMEEGKIDISQTTVNSYGIINKNFLALDLPFLFRDHDHATRVFEGPIGQKLCSSLEENSGLKGLAFTYSGGWRIIGSNEPIKSLEEIKGKRIRVNHNPVNFLTLENLGADPVPHQLVGYGYDAINQGDLDATESTYLRFKGTNILKTGHSLFLTTIAVSKQFWNSLDEDMQAIFKEAATRAARIEREWSVEDCDKFEQDCTSNGVQIHELSQEDIAQMQLLTESVYEDVKDWFEPGLIDAIKLH